MAGLGLAGGFGAGAAGATLGDILKQKFLEQIQRQQLAEQARQADMRQQTAQQGLDLQRETLGENRALRRDTLAQQASDKADALQVRDDTRFQAGIPLRIKGSYVSPVEKVRFNQLGQGGLTEAAGSDTHSADPHFHFGGTAAQEMAGDKAVTAADLARERMDATRTNAEQNRALQASIAGQSSADRRYAADLANQGRVDARAEKTAAAAKEAGIKRKAVVNAATDTMGALDELAKFDEKGNVVALKPGVANLYGMRNPLAPYFPGETATAEGARDRLLSRLTLDLIGEMKAQSRTGATGFGQLSEKELATLERSASKLNTHNMPDKDLALELGRIRQHVQKTLQEPSGAAPAPAAAGGAGQETPDQRLARLRKIAQGGQ